MRTLKFKLYKHKRNRYLKRQINAAGVIYNHCIALHKRSYRLWGKHLNCAQLQKHTAKLRKRNPFWQLVGSQAVQDICQRIDKAYNLFFKHQGLASLTNHGKDLRPPGFKKIKKYKSLALSSQKKGSRNWHKARLNLARKHEKIVNRRRDWQWKLAHELTNWFDVLYFETLNLKGMQRLWGRKIGDLALAEFLSILEWVAAKKSKRVVYIDRWFPSSKTCSECGHVLNELKLKDRQWSCLSCSTEHDRDLNAARNLKSVGASTDSLGFSQTVPDCYCCLSGESPHLQVGEYVKIKNKYFAREEDSSPNNDIGKNQPTL
ncbi:hypothetical protein BI308_16005 [Roseofilum reptotaenium AO1-A]|uniref:Transposase n=2 Tax=Roseofilum TaxID=1233426 RepID=A0A1L9QPB4_9CYAN|nr:hypothetical protein BI308_16005 [Roseofilum reptotaenium AO1-A]